MDTFPASVLLLVMMGTGCAQLPEAALLAPASMERRQIETRRFDGIVEADILSACAAVLQDLGYSVDSTESRLGLITASKERSAKDAGQIAGAIVLALLTGVTMPIDKDQTIRATVVVYPAPGRTRNDHLVRLSLQRIVRTSNASSTRSEWLKDPALYQGFFQKLSQSVFLEAHKL
jgi:hypothetical protein